MLPALNSALMLPALNPNKKIFVAFILNKIVDCYSFISSSISSTIIFTVNTIFTSWEKEDGQRLL